MIIHEDFGGMPDKSQILKVCDNTTKIYIYLWERQNQDGHVDLSWMEIARRYHRVAFMSAIKKLDEAELLTWDDDVEGIEIELIFV